MPRSFEWACRGISASILTPPSLAYVQVEHRALSVQRGKKEDFVIFLPRLCSGPCRSIWIVSQQSHSVQGCRPIETIDIQSGCPFAKPVSQKEKKESNVLSVEEEVDCWIMLTLPYLSFFKWEVSSVRKQECKAFLLAIHELTYVKVLHLALHNQWTPPLAFWTHTDVGPMQINKIILLQKN